MLTAVSLLQNDQVLSETVINTVSFRSLHSNEIEAYWDTGEPVDKAGAYAIQGLAAQFISHLDGSYSAVMGLPLYETAKLLKQAGINLLNNKRKT